MGESKPRALGTSSKPRGGAGWRRLILGAVAALPSGCSSRWQWPSDSCLHGLLPKLVLGIALSLWWAQNVCRNGSACWGGWGMMWNFLFLNQLSAWRMRFFFSEPTPSQNSQTMFEFYQTGALKLLDLS